MKYVAAIAGILIGLLFVMASVMYFLTTPPPMPAGSTMASYMAAMGPTGYFVFVKVFEFLGGVFIAIPRTRRLGLLILGPIGINILAFHTFVAHGNGLLEAPVIAIPVILLFLLWVERKAFIALAIKSPHNP
jgi:putative oxidoreductase